MIRKDISSFLLKAIEGNHDEDTIKHSTIALANLSSHKDFLKGASEGGPVAGGSLLKDSDNSQSKTEKWKVKPLIHLLDSA